MQIFCFSLGKERGNICSIVFIRLCLLALSVFGCPIPEIDSKKDIERWRVKGDNEVEKKLKDMYVYKKQEKRNKKRKTNEYKRIDW